MNKREILYRLLKSIFIVFKGRLPKGKDSYESLQSISKDVNQSCIDYKEFSNNKFDVDIIIPVYNSSKYLRKCLSSVCNQITDYKYRIIIVNDGSTDDSLDICNEFAKNSNVCLINQKNLGMSGARNSALKIVNAKYIMFIDSDDIIESNSIQLLLDKAFKNDYDIVEGGYKVINENDEIIGKNSEYTERKPMKLTGYVWGKVYKAELFENIKFPEGYWYEDTINHMIIYPQVKNVLHIPNNVYYYRANSSGICASSPGNPKSLDSLWVVRRLYKDRKLLKIEDDQAFQDYMMQLIRGCYRWTMKLDEEDKKRIFILQKEFYLSSIINEKFTYTWKDKELIKSFLTNNYNLYRLNCILL